MTGLQHTSDKTASGFWLHAILCPACLEQDRADERQAGWADAVATEAEEGYRELQAMQARGEKIPETEAV